VARFRFARIYGGWWGHVVGDDGGAVVQRSAGRYADRLRGDRPDRRDGRSSGAP
jgi:hypothetical protein